MIENFVLNMEFTAFSGDVKTQYACIRCLEIIGEAAKKLPDNFRNKNPEIPWKILAGMRDRLIHGYDTVDVAVLWGTVKNDIPTLIRNIEKVSII